MNNTQEEYIYSVKLKASENGSAVVVKHKDGYYLLTALHVVKDACKGQIIDIHNESTDIDITKNVKSTKDVDICVIRVPDDVAKRFVASAKCATFEGYDYPCEIDGFPGNAPDKRIRIEDDCVIEKETEVDNSLYVKLKEQRTDGLKMDDIEGGFSGSGVFVNSNGEKYVIGMVYKVDDIRHQFIGWKMQKINEILQDNEWTEIPLVPIELNQNILRQYNILIENSKDVFGRIRDSIIGYIRLPREDYRRKITDALNRKNKDGIANVVIITGEAGVGKSVLAKSVLCDTGFSSVAILGDDLDEHSNSEILSNLGIEDRLENLYQSPIWGDGKKVVLVESAERMLNGNTDTAILFIDNILKTQGEVTFVFTIRKHAVRMLRMHLMYNGIRVGEDNVIDVGSLDESELMEVEKCGLHILPYMESEKTRDIISIPYYLNIVCSLSYEDREDLKDDTFKDDLCRMIVEGNHDDEEIAKDRVRRLIEIARQSADNSMGLVEVESSNIVQSLEQDGIVVGNIISSAVRPNHDLLTDWAIGVHIGQLYDCYLTKKITLHEFYKNIDHNITSRNVFKAILKEKISYETEDFQKFFRESMDTDLSDFLYDDLFYVVLDSDKGADFLTGIKDLLLFDDGKLVQKIGKALSYMFRDIDFEGRRFLEEHGALDPNTKYRNSQFIVPVGKGWKTFVEFLYNNRDVFTKYRKTFIPQLLECRLVRIKEEEIGNLPQQVFEILMEDAEKWLHSDDNYDYYNEDVLNLLFKWMERGKSRIAKIAEEAVQGLSYKHEYIRRFILTEDSCMMPLLYFYPEIFKAIIQKEWIDESGIVEHYHNLHVVSASSTSYFMFFLTNYKESINLLCTLFNYDIDKKRRYRQSEIEEIPVSYKGEMISVYGNAFLWREYRGVNYHNHVQECLLMAFEKWMLDSIRNNQNKAKYALSKEEILEVYDIVYTNSHNVALWAVLASVATCYPYFVGMEAMPIYSNLTFIHWDKTRLSSEIQQPFTSSFVSKQILKEIRESYNRPHRKKDLENVILTMSMTKEYGNSFEVLIEHFKQIAKNYEDKVAIGRMDKNQYKIIGHNQEGIFLQGQPYEEISEEADSFQKQSDSFTSLIEAGNNARRLYDNKEESKYQEWKKAFTLCGTGNEILSPDCLVAAWGVKCLWQELNTQERNWCVNTIINDVKEYCGTHIYTLYIEYTSDALLYILSHEPDNSNVKNAVLFLIDSIDDNDAMFVRFENTFKSLIWTQHQGLADGLIKFYLLLFNIEKDDLQRFTQVCKLIPANYIDDDYEELVETYTMKYVEQWSLRKHNKYLHFHNTRVETFLANYMVDSPNRRTKFIKEVWLKSSLNIYIKDNKDNPVSNVFAHFSYIATKENKDCFWQLWEIMFDWYSSNKSGIVLSSLMLHFEFTRSGVLNNWEVLDGAKEHFNKLLITFKDDRYNLIPDLVCMMGFKEMLPEVLRFIDIDVLKNSVSNPKNFNIWQNAVEDLYEDSKAREEIRNNPMLSCAYVEILNALISNGSAIAYIIRDYYI